MVNDNYPPILEPYSEDVHFEDSLWYNWGGSIIQGEDQHYRDILNIDFKPQQHEWKKKNTYSS